MVGSKVGTRGHNNTVPPKKTGFAEAKNRFLGEISVSSVGLAWKLSALLRCCVGCVGCVVWCGRPAITLTSV